MIKDPYINKTLIDLDLEIEAARLVAYEVAYLQSQGEVPSIEGSVAKILGTKAEFPPETARPSTPWHAAQIVSATSLPDLKSLDKEILGIKRKINNILIK